MQRQTLLRALKWDLLAIAALLVVVVIYNLVDRPFVRQAEETQAEGSRPPDSTEGDVLLLLPDVPAAPATQLSELDCSYGWFNALWQHYGRFATVMTRNLSPELLAGRSVVIVPRRVAESLPATGISALAGFVREGGKLIVEQPGPGWEGLTGIATPKKTRAARKITSSEGLEVHGPMRKHLPDVPLVGPLQLTPEQETWPNGPTLLEIDGQPGVLWREEGEGSVYTILFDLGCTTTAMQQGASDPESPFANPSDTLQKSSSRVLSEKLKQAAVPYADLLERAIFGHLSRDRPLPRLWPFPGQHAGALVISHPSPQDTRAAIGYAEWSRKKDGVSTVFIAADKINPSQIALLEEANASLGLLWVRGEERPPLVETLGVGGLQPLEQELSLKEQVKRFEQLQKPGNKNWLVSRIEGDLFTPDWSTTFEQLADAQVRLDNSLGPSSEEEHGYLFGTGFPFYPIDERGLVLPLLEFPFLLQEHSLSYKRLDKLLLNSKSYFHQSISISVASHAMRTSPGAGTLLGLRDAHDLAKEHTHWVATQQELMEFLYARRQSVLTSRWDETAQRLTISVNLLGSTSRTLPEGALPGVAIPRTYKGNEIEKVLVDGEEVALRKLATSGPSLERILATGAGRHTISVYYAIPQAPAPID